MRARHTRSRTRSHQRIHTRRDRLVPGQFSEPCRGPLDEIVDQPGICRRWEDHKHPVHAWTLLVRRFAGHPTTAGGPYAGSVPDGGPTFSCRALKSDSVSRTVMTPRWARPFRSISDASAASRRAPSSIGPQCSKVDHFSESVSVAIQQGPEPLSPRLRELRPFAHDLRCSRKSRCCRPSTVASAPIRAGTPSREHWREGPWPSPSVVRGGRICRERPCRASELFHGKGNILRSRGVLGPL